MKKAILFLFVVLFIKANHNPLHNIPFKLCAVTDTNLNIFYIGWEYDILEYDNREEIHGLSANSTTADSIGYDSLEYYWGYVISQSVRRRWAEKPTGPHILYRTYDQPIQSHPAVYPINVEACLEKVCKEYARNEREVITILDKTNNGIENDFDYDSDMDYNGDPLFLYRNGKGQCQNFATYMTAIMHSIGIGVNCRTIVSGKIYSWRTYLDWWINTIHNYEFYVLWTEYSYGDKNFAYHMAVNYQGNIYDPSFGLNDSWADYIDELFRYYYNTACENNSPPSDPPGIWDWGANEIPTIPSPTWESSVRHREHPGCEYPR